jgi:hypothetical protein
MHSQPAKKNTHPRARDPPYCLESTHHEDPGYSSTQLIEEEKPKATKQKEKNSPSKTTNSIPKTGTKFVEEEEESSSSPSRRRGD